MKKQNHPYRPSGKKGSGSRTLRDFFPSYRESGAVRKEIEESPMLSATFHSWTEVQQETFIDFCCGNRGARILYDSFFKYVFNPDSGYDALVRLISVLLEQDVRDIRILPNESYISGDSSLLIMDIIVETGDGTIVNVEVQKTGYYFPGERAACYGSNLVMRQYRRVRQEFLDRQAESRAAKKQKTNQKTTDGADVRIRDEDNHGKSPAAAGGSKPAAPSNIQVYRNLRPVYTIVFMESSPQVFREFKDDYIHMFSQKSDTGLKLELLQNYIFIPLDIFREHLEEKEELTERDAWLAFLSSDDPQVICRILSQYPEIFRNLYEMIADLCRNTEEVIRMYDRDLAILDRNTILYMIEDMKGTIEQQSGMLEQQSGMLREKDDTIEQQSGMLREKDDTIEQQSGMLREKDETIEQQSGMLREKDETIEQQSEEIERLKRLLAEKQGEHQETE